ncbi:MAG: hypothetical protein ACKVP0_03335 [Pirellulaceae bacterium]
MRYFFTAFLAIHIFSTVQLALAASPAVPEEKPAADAKEKLAPPPPAEVLAKITAPAVSPVIKTKAGYSVEVDLSKQVLSANSPKKDIWISPNVEGNQTVEVKTDGAPLQKVSTVLAKLEKGRILHVSEEKGDWVLTQILDGDKTVKGWVQKKYLKPVAEDYPPQKSLAQRGDNFASSAMLIQKGKQFDDGLYAAVELALQNGLGPVAGKKNWLPKLAGEVDASKGGVPLAQLFAAAKLGGNADKPPAAVAKTMDAELKKFLADDKRSKPIGFYPWSKELASIFKQDRMLQSPLEVQLHSTGINAIATALAADAEARKSYEQILRVNERLTNPLKGPGYRVLLAGVDAGKLPSLAPTETVSFIPPSRSPESDLIMKLYGNSPIPNGFDLMKEVIARLKAGKLSFEPKADSGWYDHQLWSLEPLVTFKTSPESKQLKPNEEYLKHLEELFKGTYALMRETHVKQLEFPAPASEAPGEPKKEREKVFISPDPHVELLPTMYLRRALSYRFVREVLWETFGHQNIGQMHRLTATGPVEMTLASELDLMERLFIGAYIVACREIGMKEEVPEEFAGIPADDYAKIFLRWVASLSSDPDLSPDTRMMVPVFFDQQRQKTKVWVMLGWEQANCTLGYVQHPGIAITGPDGKPAEFGKPGGEETPEIHFHGTHRHLATPVFAEVYVTKLLNRTEFRRHCETYQTKAAILANLE